MSVDTTYIGLQVLMNNLFALELFFCLSHLLRLRSKKACAFVLFAGTNLTIALYCVGVPSIFRLLAITLPTYYLFPVLWSKGPLNRRLLFAALPPTSLFVGEVAGSLAYSLLANTLRYDSPAIPSNSSIVVTYSIVFFAIGVFNILLLAINSRIDLNAVAIPTLPFALLLMWSFVFCGSIIMRWEDVQTIKTFPPPSAMVLASALLYVLICFGALSVIHEESLNNRDKADSLALVRQTKHMQEEILYTTQRSVALKRLRHELAAQMSVIPSLIKEGKPNEADTRLSALFNQADKIAKDIDE